VEGRGFKSHPIISGNCVKAIPGSIPAPNHSIIEKKENIGRQMGHIQKIILKSKKYLK